MMDYLVLQGFPCFLTRTLIDQVSVSFPGPVSCPGTSCSVGDSYDNALAETIDGIYKTEVIRKRGLWKIPDEVEYATLEWVDRFNNRRLLEPIGNIPPAEFENQYYAQIKGSAMVA